MLSKQRIGILWILIAASGGATIPIFIRTVYNVSDLHPTDVALWRFIFATPLIWILATFTETRHKKAAEEAIQIKPLLLLGILFTGAVLAAMVGLQYIAASLYVVLYYTYPAMVALISLLLGNRLPLRGWIAITMTLAGVILTVGDFTEITGENPALGILIALINGLFVAIYLVLIGRIMTRRETVMRSSAWVFSGTLMTLTLAIPFFGLAIPQNWQTWAALLGLAILGTIVPIGLINIGIQFIGAARASIIATIEPVISMLLSTFLLGEIVLPVQWSGAALIILAVILLEARTPQRKRKIA